MGTKLGSVGTDFAPTAVMKNGKDGIDRTGHYLKGQYVGKRVVEVSYGPATVYSFKVLDATCDFTQGGKIVQPKEGDTVELFGTTVSNNAMSDPRVLPGIVITVTYLGIGKRGKKGNPPHLFDLEIE